MDRFKDNLLVDEHGFAHDPSDGPVPAGSVRFSQAMRAWGSFGPTPQGQRWRHMLDVDGVRARNPHIVFATNAHTLSDYSGRRDHPSCTPAVYTILQDIPRTYANHVLFMNEDSAARQALFNVLVTYADVDPSVGYCQGMSYVAAALLMHMNEEDAFWSLFTLLQSDKHLRGCTSRTICRCAHTLTPRQSTTRTSASSKSRQSCLTPSWRSTTEN